MTNQDQPTPEEPDEESSSLAQRLMGAFKEVFAEVVDDWRDVYYGADPEEEMEVWSRTDEAQEKGFERLEAIARGEEDPKTVEVKEDEDTLTFEEVEDGIVMCRFYMPLVHGDNPKRARQLLQRFIDFDDLGVDDSVSEDDGVWNDREMASAMGAMEDNSQDSRESGVPRSDIMALALFEILKKERITVRDDKGDYYTRDLVSEGDKRGKFGWCLGVKEAE